MAKRAFMTGAMIIAAGAVNTATGANASSLTDLIYRGTGQPAVSSIVQLDEDIIALGGLHGEGEFMTVAARQADSLSMAPIIVNPGGGGGGGADTLHKLPPGLGPRQDTLRPPVVPRSHRTVPKAAVPGGTKKQ